MILWTPPPPFGKPQTIAFKRKERIIFFKYVISQDILRLKAIMALHLNAKIFLAFKRNYFAIKRNILRLYGKLCV